MSWIGERSVDGGLDPVDFSVDGVQARLWLCGKHLAAPNPEAALARAGGADAIVCFCEPHELAERYPEYPGWLADNADTRSLWRPIPDLTSPTFDAALSIAEDIANRIRSGHELILHCAAGKGRAPTMSICAMILLGVKATDALKLVADARPGAGPEVGAQVELVEAFRAYVDADSINRSNRS